MEEVLKRIYFDPSNAGSFGGVRRLYREAAKEHKVSEDDVRDFLKNQNVYTLHKDRRFRFKRNRIITLYKDYQWELDIMFFDEYRKENDGMNCVLSVIDTFTKYAWMRAMPDKTPASVKTALQDIFEKDKRIPHRMRTDAGKEFDNKLMSQFYRERDILHFTTTNHTIKASIVERFQRTIKGRMYRFFTAHGHHRFVDRLADFSNNYNNSYHRSIKMTPTEASGADTQTVFSNLYEGKSLSELIRSEDRPIAEKGDTVRIAYDKGTFDKSYWSTFKDQTAKVKNVIQKPEVMYTLTDYRNKEIPRKYYKYEIQKIPEPKYRVERVLRKRKRNGRTEYYVKWLGYPASENSWVDNIGDV